MVTIQKSNLYIYSCILSFRPDSPAIAFTCWQNDEAKVLLRHHGHQIQRLLCRNLIFIYILRAAKQTPPGGSYNVELHVVLLVSPII